MDDLCHPGCPTHRGSVQPQDPDRRVGVAGSDRGPNPRLALGRLHRTIRRWGLTGANRCALAVGRVLYGLEIRGREHLPSTGPLIVVGRHLSRVDFFGSLFFASLFEETYGLAA